MDISQEAFVRAWQAISGFEPGLPFYPWYYTIMKRLALNLLRTKKRHPEAAFANEHEDMQAAPRGAQKHSVFDAEAIKARENVRVFYAQVVIGRPWVAGGEAAAAVVQGNYPSRTPGATGGEGAGEGVEVCGRAREAGKTHDGRRFKQPRSIIARVQAQPVWRGNKVALGDAFVDHDRLRSAPQ